MELPFRIVHKGLRHIPKVEYECPRCKTGLLSPLTDAGKPDECPDCGLGYTVPGGAELAKHKAEEARQAEARKRTEAEELEKRKQEYRRSREEQERQEVARQARQRERARELQRLTRYAERTGWQGVFGGATVAFGAALVGLTIVALILTEGDFDHAADTIASLIASGFTLIYFGALLMGVNYVRIVLVGIHESLDKMRSEMRNTDSDSAVTDESPWKPSDLIQGDDPPPPA